jgi:hypothetical protein
LSSADNSYNRDYHGETVAGGQRPMVNAFHRDGEAIRNFWALELFCAPSDPGQDPRHVGTLEPLWNLFDLRAGEEYPGHRVGEWRLVFSALGDRWRQAAQRDGATAGQLVLLLAGVPRACWASAAQA